MILLLVRPLTLIYSFSLVSMEDFMSQFLRGDTENETGSLNTQFIFISLFHGLALPFNSSDFVVIKCAMQNI